MAEFQELLDRIQEASGLMEMAKEIKMAQYEAEEEGFVVFNVDL
jgi:hypothetical protein